MMRCGLLRDATLRRALLHRAVGKSIPIANTCGVITGIGISEAFVESVLVFLERLVASGIVIIERFAIRVAAGAVALRQGCFAFCRQTANARSVFHFIERNFTLFLFAAAAAAAR